MGKLKQENSGTDWSVQEECLLCRIIYKIYSNFPPMPSAQALNAETGELLRFERMRSLPTGYAMAEALGTAWACKCRGRTRNRSDLQSMRQDRNGRVERPDDADMRGSPYGNSPRAPQKLGDAQPFEYKPLAAPNGDVEQVAGSNGRPGNNQAQNKQTNDVARILRLTPNQVQQLHNELGSEPPMGFHEIMERAKDMFNLW
ncbi:hypothetical protein [Paraburkholderia antibiotica]|uniref:hypothetical protein n=1 Tax=Paraburkholderia antibiotica TaxID=2728839 RepID=UPI001980D767|nr:hypothetical protein [Paraburkholderia antibiotica]